MEREFKKPGIDPGGGQTVRAHTACTACIPRFF
jgi:hypothetical protein